jgi:hypothetical protein
MRFNTWDKFRERKRFMNAQRFRETLAGSSRLLLLKCRHIIVAPLVSFVTSFWALVPGIFLIALFGQHVGRAMCFTLVGFCGVLSGACFLPQRNRGFGAIALTLLGMIYYSGCIAEWHDVVTDEGKMINMRGRSLAELILLGFGGLLATASIVWFSSVTLKRIRQKAAVLTFRSHNLVRRS